MAQEKKVLMDKQLMLEVINYMGDRPVKECASLCGKLVAEFNASIDAENDADKKLASQKAPVKKK